MVHSRHVLVKAYACSGPSFDTSYEDILEPYVWHFHLYIPEYHPRALLKVTEVTEVNPQLV